jgi:hypothetical protein
VSSQDISCTTFEPGLPYITIKVGYVEKDDFMWVQLIHSKGDIRSVLKCTGVRVGDFDSKSTFTLGCSKKRFFIRQMELDFEPNKIEEFKYLLPERGLVEVVELQDRIIIRNLGDA